MCLLHLEVSIILPGCYKFGQYSIDDDVDSSFQKLLNEALSMFVAIISNHLV
jgi:hypothetical protein